MCLQYLRVALLKLERCTDPELLRINYLYKVRRGDTLQIKLSSLLFYELLDQNQSLDNANSSYLSNYFKSTEQRPYTTIK